MTITGHATEYYTEYYIVTECNCFNRRSATLTADRGTGEDGALIVIWCVPCPARGGHRQCELLGLCALDCCTIGALTLEVLTRPGKRDGPVCAAF